MFCDKPRQTTGDLNWEMKKLLQEKICMFGFSSSSQKKKKVSQPKTTKITLKWQRWLHVACGVKLTKYLHHKKSITDYVYTYRLLFHYSFMPKRVNFKMVTDDCCQGRYKSINTFREDGSHISQSGSVCTPSMSELFSHTLFKITTQRCLQWNSLKPHSALLRATCSWLPSLTFLQTGTCHWPTSRALFFSSSNFQD